MRCPLQLSCFFLHNSCLPMKWCSHCPKIYEYHGPFVQVIESVSSHQLKLRNLFLHLSRASILNGTGRIHPRHKGSTYSSMDRLGSVNVPKDKIDMPPYPKQASSFLQLITSRTDCISLLDGWNYYVVDIY